jgi:hypothetical protein
MAMNGAGSQMISGNVLNKSEVALASISDKQKTCREMGDALAGDIGDIVAKHEVMILEYYQDVQTQAKQSFDSADKVARYGFWVLIATLGYVFVTDFIRILGYSMTYSTITVAQVGVISGFLMECIAGVQFWLYSRAAKQFSAFHICLERTHRYLIAYKISEKIQNNKDETLENLVCIMANAPMITREDIDEVGAKPISIKTIRDKIELSPSSV